MVCEAVARQANLVFQKPRIGMVGLTGHGLNIVAEAEAIISYDGLSIHTDVLIADNIPDVMLVCWHDLQAIDVISKSFPARLRTTVTSNLFKDIKSKILEEFPQVFQDSLGEAPMNVPKMKIHLTKDNVPFRISTARQVPFRFQEAATRQTQALLDAGVICKEPDPQPWCALGFWVPKANGIDVRLVTDFQNINKFVIRPVHPFPAVKDIVRSIPAGTKFFAKLDAVHGYFQLALDEESSKLTTFLLPSGRYRYLRAPMGLSCSSDEWCRHSDEAIEGLGFARKIVDDILIWAEEIPQLHERIRIVAKRCSELNILLSKKKLEIGSEISFAGLLLSEKGVKPDPVRIQALTDFPTPKDVSGVRSFLGLANQLSGFVPDFSHMSVNLRALTAKKNAFLWLDHHEQEFQTIKKLLTSDMVVCHFDPNLPVTLLTDASRLHGLGYAMGHYVDGRFRLVACGSKSLTPTQQRYATVELECLAVYFAISKCSFYLKGSKGFSVSTDHKPLVGVFQKDLFDIGNPRLQRIREKLVEYTFTVDWVPGKTHHIADALSRAPLFSPEDEDDMQIDNARVCLAQLKERNVELAMILDSIDADYVKFKYDVKNGTCESVYANQMKSILSQLSVDEDLIFLDAQRIVVPKRAVKKILSAVHISHIGVNKTYDLCRALYFWPGMINDIKQMIAGCVPCSVNRPSLPKNERISAQPSSYLGPPMGHVGVDLFDFGGKQHLICVDQWSGYPLFASLSKTTSAAVISQLRGWFNLLGWPQCIRSDGGPQFRAEFIKFCQENCIKHEVSSPYNPSANGLAESGVKIVKSILIKCLGEGKDIQRVLYEWRNAPRNHGFSPAQLLFGRSQRMMIPQPAAAFEQVNLVEAAVQKDKLFAATQEHYNRDKLSQPKLLPGQLVRVQQEKEKTWKKLGTIIEMRPDGQSYFVNIDGSIFLRGRAMLRPISSEEHASITRDQISGGVISEDPGEIKEFVPRRSERLEKKKSEECVGPQPKRMLTPSGASIRHSSRPRPLTRPFPRMPGDSPWLTFSGPASQQGPQQSLSSGCASSSASSSCGAAPGRQGVPGPGILNSSVPSLPPAPPPLLPPWQALPLPVLQPFHAPLMGPGYIRPHPVGPVSQPPICHQTPCRSQDFPFPNSLPCFTRQELVGSTQAQGPTFRDMPPSSSRVQQLSDIIAVPPSVSPPASPKLKKMDSTPPRLRLVGNVGGRSREQSLHGGPAQRASRNLLSEDQFPPLPKVLRPGFMQKTKDSVVEMAI